MVNERNYLKKETLSQIYETKLQNNIVIVSSKSVTLIDQYNTTKQQNLKRKKKECVSKYMREQKKTELTELLGAPRPFENRISGRKQNFS